VATLAEALTAKTESEIEAEILDEAASRDLDVRGLGERSFPRGMVAIEARSHAKYQELRARLVANRLLDTAVDVEGVALVARGWYQLERAPATYAVHEVRLTDTGGVGPKAIRANERTFISASGQEFRITQDVVVPAGGTSAPVQVRAEVAGAAGNVQANTITRWRNPIAGLTVSNPAIGSSGSSLVAAARDAEDKGSLIQRCRDRWGTQGRAGNDAAYRTWVTEAFTSAGQVSPITRMRIRGDNPYGPGSIGVVLANASGPALPGEVSQVDTYLRERKALGSGPLVTVAATAESVPAAIVVYASGNPSAVTQAIARMDELEASLPIGATIYQAEILERVMGIDGVYNVRINAPLVDYQASPLAVIDFTPLTVTLG
jgi:uncharacterized phage protein gp47/JayE